jgi:hypothetical protein
MRSSVQIRVEGFKLPVPNLKGFFWQILLSLFGATVNLAISDYCKAVLILLREVAVWNRIAMMIRFYELEMYMTWE